MLEDILKTLNSKHPFKADGDLSETGHRAYNKLIFDILGGLNKMGVISGKEYSRIVTELDEITNLKM